MAFFPEEEQRAKAKKQGRASEADVARAKRLGDALFAKRIVAKRPGVAAWANVFRLLREVDAIDDERADAAVAWLIANIGGRFVPQVYSAKVFRAKFPAIEAAMRRDGSLIAAKPSKAADKLVAHMKADGYADSPDKLVAAVAQTTVDGFREFAELLERVQDSDEASNGDKRLARHAVEWLNACGRQNLSLQFVSKRRRRTRSDAIDALAFGPQHWSETLRTVAKDWNGNADAGDRLKDLLDAIR